MPNRDVHNMRESYESSFLLEEDCDVNPFQQFDKWFHHALDAKLPEPNAMTLATVGINGQPSARVVLLKSYSKLGFTFYTNYESKKGRQMLENDKVALLFWWQERQVRIEGVVNKLDKGTAEKYFHSRPKDSQIGALISPQSQVLTDRRILEERYNEAAQQYTETEVPMPAHWGGFVVVPDLFEFWQGRVSRLHDRIQYTLVSEDNWKMERLAP